MFRLALIIVAAWLLMSGLFAASWAAQHWDMVRDD